jgi:hypothetical protein
MNVLQQMVPLGAVLVKTSIGIAEVNQFHHPTCDPVCKQKDKRDNLVVDPILTISCCVAFPATWPRFHVF